MEYSDNPRKVYGKVEIVYADEELSHDVKTKESGNSEVSHPYDTYHKPYEPTAKACTMDGNSTMDGTFQMIDDSLVIGWWSGALANASGGFTVTPVLEMTFTMRPILTWRVAGDNKLNQYPVDFTLEYLREGKTVQTETVKGNTEIELEFKPMLEDITGVRLTVTKWSHPGTCVKILRCFDKISEWYEGVDLQGFEVNEELCSSEGNYNINADSMTVTMYNDNRKFDKGYLRTLMLLDRKVYPYIGIEKNGEIKYIPLGCFYSEEWDIPQDSQWVKCTASDRLMHLQIKTYVGFPLLDNVSLYEIAEDILTKMGLTPEEYSITPSLKDFVVDTALLPKTTGWDALQEVANAGLCKVFVDRSNRICLTCEADDIVQGKLAINPGNAFSYKSTISLTNFSNSISVDYCEITIEDDIIDVAEPEITLDANEERTVTIDYTSEVAYPLAVCDNTAVQIVSFDSGVNSCSCTLKNLTGSPQTAIITVSGNAINIETRTVKITDDESIAQYGCIEYVHPTSELVQSYEQAEYMARLMFKRLSAKEGTVTAVWRGNPELEVGIGYECIDRFGDKERLVCEYNKFSFDGGLTQETRGRKQ